MKYNNYLNIYVVRMLHSRAVAAILTRQTVVTCLLVTVQGSASAIGNSRLVVAHTARRRSQVHDALTATAAVVRGALVNWREMLSHQKSPQDISSKVGKLYVYGSSI